MKTRQLTIKKIIFKLFFITILLCFNNCSEESIGDGKISDEVLESINTFLADLNNFSQPDVSDEEFVEEVTKEREGQTEECVVNKYKMAPGFSEMILLDPTSDVIYPGAMLKGESIPTGEYIGINGGRAPITLSVSLDNLNGKPSTIIENPSLDTVRKGVKDLLQQGVTGSTAAKVNFTTEEVYSEEHLSVALGASYSKGKNTISGSFNFSSTEKKYRYVIKFLQVYYTIDLSLPDNDNPGLLFTSVPNLDSTSPVIVSSVKYGRMLLYTVETNSEYSDTDAAFAAAFNGGEINGEGEYKEFWESSTVKALVVGGSSGDAAKVVSGPEGVYDYIVDGGEFSADSPGGALGYTLRYIKKDFPIANVVLSSEYNIRSCYEAYQKFHVQLHGLKLKENNESFDDINLHGTMRARLYQDGKSKGLVSYTRTTNNYINVDVDEFWSIPNEIMQIELYKPDLENDYVEFYAHFKEDDVASGNEDFGARTRKIYLKDLKMGEQDSGDPRDSGDLSEGYYNYFRVDLIEENDAEMRTYFKSWRVY